MDSVRYGPYIMESAAYIWPNVPSWG